MSRGRAAVRFAVAAIGARAGYAALTRRALGDDASAAWTKTNHRGEPVTLLEGPAVAAAAVAGALAVPGLHPAERLALGLAGAGSCAVGRYDDLAGDAARHGFRGHLGALRQGEVTTGTVKIAGIGALGLTAGLLLSGRRGGSVVGRAADVAIDSALVAGSANLMNLFDLRPGRAIKVAAIASAALAAAGPHARTAVAAPAGAAIALLPEDLGERAMLGDAGANALGAMLGVAAAASLSRPARLGVLAGIAGLTAASEKVSFTKVIERTAALRWLDMLGRRAVGPADATAAAKTAAREMAAPDSADPVPADPDSADPDSADPDSAVAASTPRP